MVKDLLAKLIIDDVKDIKHIKFHSDIRKVILENKSLAERVTEYMDDKISLWRLRKVLTRLIKFNT